MTNLPKCSCAKADHYHDGGTCGQATAHAQLRTCSDCLNRDHQSATNAYLDEQRRRADEAAQLRNSN